MKTKEHFIMWDSRNCHGLTAHPSEEAAERYFRQQENIPDDVTIEQYHEMREAVEESGAEAPEWMNTRDNCSHIIGQIEIVPDPGVKDMAGGLSSEGNPIGGA